MKNLGKIFKSFLVVSAIAPFTAFAQTIVNINTNIPGPSTAASGIQGLITNFYSFALTIAGILAFGAIVYGGVRYAVGRGNPSAESEGRSWITGALLGLLLLAGAYVIMYTINPDIVALQIPGLPQLSSSTESVNNPINPTSTTPSGPVGARCQAPASGGCSVANLTANGGSCFGSNVNLAGGVCNVESANGAFLYSTVDKCDDGSPVSFGLFQINISANTITSNGVTLACNTAFSNPYTGSNPHCTITNRTLYNQCVQAALTPANNIAKACALSGGGNNFSQWGPATRAACGL